MSAEFRSVQTRMWREDEWFQGLDTDARLLFIYLFTNPSASISGIYRLPLRTMAFESGLSVERVIELLAQFSAANKAHYADGTLWVVRMRENQIPGIVSPKVKVRLDKDVAAVPDSPLKTAYLTHYGYPINGKKYPIDTVSIPATTETETETDTETVTVTSQALASSCDASTQRTDADLTRAIVAKMESAGIGVTEITVDNYVAAAMDYGIHAVLSGIDAAASNGKQHKTSYVLACIRNKAQGVAPKTNGTNGNGYMSHEEREKLQADLKATQNRIRTAEKLGSVAAQRDLDLMTSLQQKLGGAM